MLGNVKYNLKREYKFYATIPRGQKRDRSSYKKKEIAYKRLNIRTTLQAVALEVCMAENDKRRMRTVYLPPADLVTEEGTRDLMEQLLAPMILLEDFKTHNPLWKN